MAAIDSMDALVAAMTQRSQLLPVNKGSLSNVTAGGWTSLWRATGVPAQGAIPAAAAVCTSALTGALPFAAVDSTQEMHVVRAFLVSSNTGTDVQLYDRLAHMGGLSGTVTTAQTVNVTVSGTANNMEARRGKANYSDVLWWVEWYTDTGSTATTLTVNVTYDDDSSGNIAIATAATMRAARMLPIVPAVAGRFIKTVNTAQLTATTGSVGSFGVTASRRLTSVALGIANSGETVDWAMLGLPRIEADVCLWQVVVSTTTTTGTLSGGWQVASGALG